MGTAAINRWNWGILLEAQAAMCRCRYCSMDDSDLLERAESLGRAHTAPARGKCSHPGVWLQGDGAWALPCIPCIPWGTPSTDPGAAGLCWLLQEGALSLPRERDCIKCITGSF